MRVVLTVLGQKKDQPFTLRSVTTKIPFGFMFLTRLAGYGAKSEIYLYLINERFLFVGIVSVQNAILINKCQEFWAL